VAGTVNAPISGIRASVCAATTNVRSSPAAVIPANVPHGQGGVTVARGWPVAVARMTALVCGVESCP
jgi:hypothetical protein